MNKRQRKREERFQRKKASQPKPPKLTRRKQVKQMVNFPLYTAPSYDIPFVIDAPLVNPISYQLQIAGDIFPPINQVIVGGSTRSRKKRRSPQSLKMLAKNVLLKHRPHKDWVEFCCYPKYFRDRLIHPLLIKVITPQLLE
jgi:hypothetical protein